MSTSKLPVVQDIRPTLGCDPELFIRKGGEVIGSEKVIPEKGLYDSTVIRDGVQVELNPSPSTCRAELGDSIEEALMALQDRLAEQGNDLTADFSQTVLVSKKSLTELSADSRRFGCAPSKSVYASKMKVNSVDPLKYLTRSAGGHIHLGHSYDYDDYHDYDSEEQAEQMKRALTVDAERTVQLLDIICGNTCVMIDQNPKNKERRKLYGRAGEYRSPKHGLEYRTLSNFWLLSYPLMSLSFGLARLAVQLMADPLHHNMYYDAFTKVVNLNDVRDAINRNNFNMAGDNFNAIEPLLKEVIPLRNDGYPFNADNIKHFHHFVNMITQHGLKYWFKVDPMKAWTESDDEYSKGPKTYRSTGFNDFLNTVVAKDKAA